MCCDVVFANSYFEYVVIHHLFCGSQPQSILPVFILTCLSNISHRLPMGGVFLSAQFFFASQCIESNDVKTHSQINYTTFCDTRQQQAFNELDAVTCDSPSPTNKKTSRHVTAAGLIRQSGFKDDKPSHSQTPAL